MPPFQIFPVSLWAETENKRTIFSWNHQRTTVNMALYSIESEQYLGISHSGEVTVNGESAVELTNEEVATLVQLIKEKGTTDVDELDIATSHPALYHKLDEAYSQMAYDAEELQCLWDGYERECFEYDTEELMDYCERECGFSFEFKPEEYFDEDELEYYEEDPESYEDEIDDVKREAFSKWLDGYVRSLSDEEVKTFFFEHMNADPWIDDVSYTVEIPAAIIQKATQTPS